MFLFASPMILLIVVAMLPVLYLISYVYRMDKLDKEPPHLIGRLVLYGAFATFFAVITERLGIFLLSLSGWPADSLPYRFLMYFLVVGLSEEGFKYLMLRRLTWFSPFFNCQFDALVYAVTLSLGFALWENIQYVFAYGMGTALVRAVTAVPGHACFGVFMGIWYGHAKRCYNRRQDGRSRLYGVLALLIPTLIHGAYDFIATSGKDGMLLYFIVFVILMFFVAYLSIRRSARRDTYL